MIRHPAPLVALFLTAALGLPGCKGEFRAEAAPVPTPVTPVRPTAAPQPERVLQDWAAAIGRRDWTAVRGLWGQRGADSGLSPRAFARRWSRLHHPRAAVSAGDQEGAAGSLYYTATLTLHDGPRRVTQPVTIRRVNDVDGASAEQLRWHFERSTRLVLPGAGRGARRAGTGG